MINTSRLIEKSISSAYDTVRQTNLQSSSLAPGTGFDATESMTSVCRSFIDLPKELFQMLASVGPYLHRDTMLLQKVHYLFLIF